MRGSRISHPLPDGKGIFVSATALPSRPVKRSPRRRIVSCIIAVVAALAVGTPARAVENVTVSLLVDLAEYQAGATLAECDVSVPEEADGVAVLDAAEASECIDSWTPQQFGEGTFVECINDICGQAVFTPDYSVGVGTYWEMRENGAYAWYGVDDFEALQGDELSFTYVTWGPPLPDPEEEPEVPEAPDVPSLPY